MQQRALNDLCRIVELTAKLLTAQLEGPRLAEVQKLLAEKNVENERINRQLLASEGLITAWNTYVGAGGFAARQTLCRRRALVQLRFQSLSSGVVQVSAKHQLLLLC
jgi:hypothetical protein